MLAGYSIEVLAALLGIEPRPKGLEASVLTVTPWGSIEGLVARTKPVNYI